MAKYLRDEFIRNITVTEETLVLVNDFLTERETTTNAELERNDSAQDQMLFLTYVIRFDGRGYKLTDFDDVKKYYNQANRVERVIFLLDSAVSEGTGRMYGTHYELRLDSKDQNNSYIQATSDDGDAVDSIFCGLMEIVDKCRNKNGLIRNTWSQLLIQVFGVIVGFLLSLIAGLKAAPHINIENSFIITFVFAFLIFSNAWGFINQQILRFVDYTFPNINYYRQGKSAMHWLGQTLVGGLVVAFTLLVLSNVFEWVGKVLEEYVAK